MLTDIPASFWTTFASHGDDLVMTRVAGCCRALRVTLAHLLPPRPQGPWDVQLRRLQRLTNDHSDTGTHVLVEDLNGNPAAMFLAPQEAFRCPRLTDVTRLATVEMHVTSAAGLMEVLLHSGLTHPFPTRSMLVIHVPVSALQRTGDTATFPSRTALVTLARQLDDILSAATFPHPMGAGSARIVTWNISALGHREERRTYHKSSVGLDDGIQPDESERFDITVDARWQPRENMVAFLTQTLEAVGICCGGKGSMKVLRGFNPA